MSDAPIDLVASMGELDPVIETLRSLLHDSGAVRVVAVVDSDDDKAVVDVARLAPVEITLDGRVSHLPHAIDLDAEPLARFDVRQLPPFEVDAEAATVIGTMGGLDMIADALRELCAVLPGRSVALAQFSTTATDLELTVSARTGEPVIVAIGDDQFELP